MQHAASHKSFDATIDIKCGNQCPEMNQIRSWRSDGKEELRIDIPLECLAAYSFACSSKGGTFEWFRMRP